MGQYRVIVTRRPKYAGRTCQEAAVQAPAPAPALLIEGALLSERLVAHVVVAKYADHRPLYRQAQILARQGIAIDRATLAFWVGYAAAEIRPGWRLLREELLRSTKLFVDETTAPGLDPGRGRIKKGYFWVLARDDRPGRGAAGGGVQLRAGAQRRSRCGAAAGLHWRAANRRLCRLSQPRRSEARRQASHARVLPSRAGVLPSPPLTHPDERISRLRFFARELCSRHGVLVDDQGSRQRVFREHGSEA